MLPNRGTCPVGGLDRLVILQSRSQYHETIYARSQLHKLHTIVVSTTLYKFRLQKQYQHTKITLILNQLIK